jgi:hypothetical protein
MAIDAISGSLAPQPPTTQATTNAQAPASTKAPAQQQAPVQPAKDTIKLSGAALVKSLKTSGMNAAQIAQASHLDQKTVDQYLRIAAPKVASAPAAPAGTQAEQAATPAPAATTPQGSPHEEAAEPAAEKAAEANQGKK